MAQLPLFGHGEEPAIDPHFSSLKRLALGRDAWLDIVPAWLSGQLALFELLLHAIAWRSETRVMYDRTVEVPRRYAVVQNAERVHPVLEQMRAALNARYSADFERLSLALYRDGRDNVAFHGDYVARKMHSALVATVSVGAPRKFLLRPKGGGRATVLSLGWGDLLVMGGTCQRTYEHAIPKVVAAEPRIAIMFRPQWHEDDADLRGPDS
jgi:alkylated DNA repair dioxygenase AlkB